MDSLALAANALCLALLASALGFAIRRLRTAARSREELRKRAGLLDAVVQAVPDGILLSDRLGRVAFVNRRALELLGFEAAELAAGPIQIPLPQGLRAVAVQHARELQQVSAAPSPETLQHVPVRRRDGSELQADVSFSTVDLGGSPHVVSVIRDAAEARRDSEAVRSMAFYDSLTGLPNRRLLQERLRAAIRAAQDRDFSAAVLFIDLDGFKKVNDSFGHSVGDEMLRKIAERLLANVRAEDDVGRSQLTPRGSSSVSRLGGDEFIVLLSQVTRPDDAGRVARRILKALDEEIAVDHYRLSANASIGIATFPDDGHDVESLLRSADAAMYAAKSAGGRGFRFASASLNETALRRHEIGVRLRKALRAEGLDIQYQPLRDAMTGVLTGAEALLRWEDPELGAVSPAEFTPVAEETGLILSIGRWMLETVCGQLRSWRDAGLRSMPVSVNVSPAQLRSPGFAASCAQILRRHGLGVASLELEISESAFLQRDPHAIRNLEELRELGLSLVLVDFGTGFSSLAHLMRHSIRRIKIDRSLVAAASHQSQAGEFVAGLTALARCLRIRTTAEGVETQEQLSLLQAEGCTEVQGFLLSRPVDAKEFQRFLEREEPAEPGC